jgi:RNA polymerase sigma-70 factor (TIGR02943 family)
MVTEQLAIAPASPDPATWLDQHGDCLYRFALFRLHDSSVAEDVVQETLLAALQAYHSFAARGSERTWLVGILKHKITDHYRRVGRETLVSQFEEESLEHNEFFRQEGEWVGHWEQDRAPLEWKATPEDLVEQGEFFEVLSRCLSPLPERIRAAFTLREVDGVKSEEICDVLGVSANNLWVMLHRARLHLRRCLELNWFKPKTSKH